MESQITATYNHDGREQGGRFSRREFMRVSAVAAAGTALAACAPKPSEVTEGLPQHQVLYYPTNTYVGNKSIIGISEAGIIDINRSSTRPSTYEIAINGQKVEIIIGYGPFFEQDNLAVLHLASIDNLPENVVALSFSVVEGKQKGKNLIE